MVSLTGFAGMLAYQSSKYVADGGPSDVTLGVSRELPQSTQHRDAQDQRSPAAVDRTRTLSSD